VAHGDFTMLLPDHESVYAFTRRLPDDPRGDVELLVLGNFSGDDVRVDIDEGWAGSELVLGNYPDAAADVATLRPWEARVHRLVRPSPPSAPGAR
jgi:oligo-1,6-glucosidase